jgi:hypothetical protein
MTDLAATGGIDAATIGGKLLTVALCGAATIATGSLLYGAGTSQMSVLAPGASGTVLVSQGAGNAPAWVNIFGNANTWTAAQTIATSSGSVLSQTGTPLLTLSAADTVTPRINFDGFGTSGALLVGRAIGGTKASQSATPGDVALHIFGGTGYDTGPSTGLAASYRINADGTWSGSNNGAYHRWDGTPNGSLLASRAEWMRLQGGNLGIGTSPVANSGYLQIGKVGTGTADLVSATLATAVSDSNFVLRTAQGATTNASGDIMAHIGLWYSTTKNAQIQFHRGATGSDGFMSFTTANAERMRLDSVGNLGIGVTPTAGNGSLQLTSGTTKANGIAFGTSHFLYRSSGSDFVLQTTGTYTVLNLLHNSGACIGQMLNEGTFSFVGTSTAHEFRIRTSNTDRFRIDSVGNFHLRGGTPVTPSPFTAWTGTATRSSIATGSATVANCAEAIKALIDDLKYNGVLP